MDLQNCQTPIPVWTIDSHTAVETTGTQQRLVQPIRAVGGGNDDNCLVGVETIHLDEQLVQGLLTFIIGIDARTTLTANCIKLVNKDDAGRSFLGLLEQVTHAAGTDTN